MGCSGGQFSISVKGAFKKIFGNIADFENFSSEHGNTDRLGVSIENNRNSLYFTCKQRRVLPFQAVVEALRKVFEKYAFYNFCACHTTSNMALYVSTII